MKKNDQCLLLWVFVLVAAAQPGHRRILIGFVSSSRREIHIGVSTVHLAHAASKQE
jgi:hypothetical protein